MRDLTLQCAGIGAIAVALIHGVLGETKVFAKATIEPERLRTLIRVVWQAGTVAWIGGGGLLVPAPSLGRGSRTPSDVGTVTRAAAVGGPAHSWWARGCGFCWRALGRAG